MLLIWQNNLGAAIARTGGFEMVYSRMTRRKPLLQRILEEKAHRIKVPKARRIKAKVIEIEAAKQVLAGSSEKAFSGLLAQWVEKVPAAQEVNTGPSAEQLFMAQVAFRIAQLQHEAEQAEQDEEEAVLALLFT